MMMMRKMKMTEKMFLMTKDGIKGEGQPVLPGDERKYIVVGKDSLFFRSKKQKAETVMADFVSFLQDSCNRRPSGRYN